MKPISVWSPTATSIAIDSPSGRFEMARQHDDWWVAPEELRHGEDYAFIVDGEGPFPDPRSQWQPQGIHKTSRVYDHDNYKWQDQSWNAPVLSSAIVYELHIGTFTTVGTFSSAIEKLDYLVELGITHVEVMPVSAFPGTRGWGYDGVQLYAPHAGYGSPDDLKDFVDACHNKGLAVILDVVYNHLGPSGNYLEIFGPYFTDRYHTPWGKAVNFDDAYCDEVRQFFIDNALMWLRDYHIDGLRLDAVHEMSDRSAEHFLKALARNVKELENSVGRSFFLVAESDLNDPKFLRPRSIGGYGIDSQWCDDLHHSLHAFFTGEREGYYADFGNVSQIAKAMQQAYVYDGLYSKYRRHQHGEKPDLLTGAHFFGYTQTHDQVGNRAKGERIGHLISVGQMKIAAALMMVSPFIPMIFQGEEWGASTPFQYFTDHQEPELGKAVSEGRKREFMAFGWQPSEVPDPQASSTFEASMLNWEENEKGVHQELFQWYQSLIKLRKLHSHLGCGPLNSLNIDYDGDGAWMSISRQSLNVYCNFSKEPQEFSVAEKSIGALLLSSSELHNVVEGKKLTLPAETVAIFETANS